ncbi:MAG: ATP-binding protein [Thalassobaculaceae bacterium]|nr:ATP-binding protein [Thalassobaculaceae bacterium]
MRLRNLLFLALSGVAILPVLALAGWVYVRAHDREIQIVDDTHLLLARNLGAALERYSRDVISAFELSAETALSGADVAQVAKLMRDLNFVHLCMVSVEDGGMIDSVVPSDYTCPGTIPEARFKIFMEAARTDRATFSGVMARPNGAPTLYVLRIYGDVLAIGAISTRYIVERGKAIAFGVKGHAAIVDHTGRVMAHPLPSWIAEMKLIAKVDPVARMLRRETGTTIFYSPALNADMVAGFTFVPTTGWGVMIPQPLAEIEQHADEAAFYALLIGIAGLAMAAVLSWFLAGYFTRPIGAVVVATRRMAQGDLEARVTRDGGLQPVEAIELADAFNAMAAEISRKNADLREALVRAEEGARAKTNFLATISHEIRTPMNGVLGTSEFLLDTNLDHEQRRIAQTINESAKSLLEIVNDVLDMSRIEAGHVEMERAPVAMVPLVEGLVTELSPIAEAKGLTLYFETRQGVPASIECDATRLRQILVNLINNGIKFTDRGWIRVVMRCQQDEGGQRRLEVAVQDTGIGIPETVLPTLFEPFVQADASTTRRYGGSGLGLAISRRLAELLGGKISASSVEGEGSIFSLILPLAENGAVLTAGERLPTAPGGDHPSPANPALAGLRVLVAEDHSTNRWMLSRQLSRLGLIADVREDGAEALAAFRANHFDVVVTDYLMPEMDGIELTRAIREINRQSGERTPILGLTANAFQDSIDRCHAAGMDAVLTKPVEQSTIGRAIADLLAGKRVWVPLPAAEKDADQGSFYDPSMALELFGTEPESGKAWIADFTATVREKMDALAVLRQAGPIGTDVAFPILHALKGVSDSAGAARLGAASRRLAEAARTGDRDTLNAGLDDLHHVSDETVSAASSFAENWASDSTESHQKDR